MKRDIFDEFPDVARPDIFDSLDLPAVGPSLQPAGPAPQNVPDFSTYRPPGRIDINGTAPGPMDFAVQPKPEFQAPFLPQPRLDTYQTPGRNLMAEQYPGQRLQREADAQQPGPIEFGSGFAKGAARSASAGTYNPAISRIEQAGSEAGSLAGGMVPLALAAFPATAPFVVPAMVAQQGLPATAGDVEQTGELRHPARAAVSVAMAEALAVLPPAIGKSLAARGLTGAGIGELQSVVTQAIDAKAQGGELDLTSPEAVKDQVIQTLFGLAFGVSHGGQARAPEGQRPPAAPDPLAGEFERQPLSEPRALEKPWGLSRSEEQPAPAGDIFDSLAPDAPPQEPARPVAPPEPPKAPDQPEIKAPASPPGREAYIQHLRDTGIPEEQIQAGMQHVDRAPIQDIFDLVDIRTPEPPAAAAPPDRGPTSEPPYIPEGVAPPAAAPVPLKPPTAKAPAMAEQRPVLHVGAHVAALLRGQKAGVKNPTLRVNPEDVARLGLYNGQASDPVPMTPKQRWAILGRPVKIDPTAPSLTQLAHGLNERMAEHQGEPLLIVGHDAPDPDYGYNADDLAQALINRPRSKHALEAEVTQARGADRTSDQAHIDSIDPKWTSDSNNGLKQEAPVPQNDTPEEILFQHVDVATAGIPETHADNPKVLEAAAKAWKEKGTDSPFFRKWFGGSKAVDESGKPKVLYHGTGKSGFEYFDTYASNHGLFGQGAYLTENPEIASSYAKKKFHDMGDEDAPGVYKTFAKIENPIDMDGSADIAKWEKAYPDADYSDAKTNEQAYRAMEEGLRDEGLPKWEGAEAAQGNLRSMGYDGITHIGGGRARASDGTKHRVWIAFEPEQIKSATGNRGTFDARDPNILKEDTGPYSDPGQIRDPQGDIFKGPGHQDSEPVDFLKALDNIRGDDHGTSKAKRDGAAAAREILGTNAASDVPVPPRRGTNSAERRARNMLAIGLDADFRKQGFVDLRGKTAKTPDELGTLAQVFRDPRFETFRVFYVDDNGTLLAHDAMTSRLPSSAAIHPKEAVAKIKHYAAIESRMKRLGATGYYLSHNHPSGRVTPSSSDYQATRFMRSKIKGNFLGHVIINHKKFSFFRNEELDNPHRGSGFHERFLPGHDTPDPVLIPDKPHGILGMHISSAEHIALMGASLKTPANQVTLLFRGSRSDVVAISSFHKNELRNEKSLSGKIRNMASAYGGQPIAYIDGGGIAKEALKGLWDTGHFLDVVRGRGPGVPAESLYEATNGRTATNLTLGVDPGERFRRTQEEPTQYQAGDEKAKGRFHMEGKKAIITLFKGKADFSTWMHEHAHLLRRAALTGQDETTIVKWLQDEGLQVHNEKGVWTTEAEERFARGFERYLRDGKAPTAAVKPLFERIKQYMREIYQTIRGTELDGAIPEHVRWVYDRLVGARNAGEPVAAPEPARGRDVLFQKSKNAPADQDHVGPAAPRAKNTGGETLGKAISYEAGAGDSRSGWLTKAEKMYTDAVNETLPLEKIQKVFEATLPKGQKVAPNQSIKYAINRVLGSGGSANHFIVKNLKPIFQGGEVEGVKYPKLTPAEGRLVDDYTFAKDALWRYNNTKGYDNPALTREHAMRILGAHLKLSPEVQTKVRTASEALISYAKDLARRKMEAGLPSWTLDKFEVITKNPFYVPEIRDFDKVMSKPAGRQGKKMFTSVNKLIRGTFAVDVDAPVRDVVTALVHETHQFATEVAKMGVWNRAIDLVESNKTLQGWIKRMPKDWAPTPEEGEVAVIRPGQVHLNPEQQAFADKYKKALFTIKAQESVGREDEAVRHQYRKIQEEADRSVHPSVKARTMVDINRILDKVGERREFYKKKRLEAAEETLLAYRRRPEAERNLIQDWIDEGEPTRYLVPKEISDSVNGMNPIEWAWFQKPLVMAASLFRKMQVGWNPDFTLSNTPRDVQEAYYNVGMRPTFMIKGLAHYFKKDAVYDAFMKNGGSMEGDESGFRASTDISQDIRYGGRFMKDRYSKVKDSFAWEDKKITVRGKELNYGQLARIAEAVKKTIGVPFEIAEAIGEAGEMMTRLGVMDMAMNKKKLSPAEAADMSRQATLDFKRIGAKMKGANALIPFLNARIQGMDRLVRTAKDDPVGAATRAFISAAAPAAVLLAWNSQNVNYQDIPASEKEYYWILMKDRTGSTYFKIAKGFVPQLVMNPIQMGLENLLGTAKKDWWKIGLDVLKSGLPVDDVGSTLNPGLKLPLEYAANYDFYFDRDIVKAPGRSPAYQFDPNTAETMKTVGRALNLSPAVLQHVASGLLGGTSNNILFALDFALGHSGLQANKDRPLEYMPFIKRVFGQTQSWKSDLAQKQRTLFKEKAAKDAAIKSFRSDIARADEEGDANAAAYLEKGLEQTHDELGKVQDQLGEIEDALAALEDLKKKIGDAHKSKR